MFTKRNPDDLPPWLADMPRQLIKQIEEEEAAIKAVITQEQVEGKVSEDTLHIDYYAAVGN